MFADSMLETSWAQRAPRGWMTLSSLGLQALAAAFLLLLPLIGTTAFPQLRPLSPPVSLAPPPGPLPTPSHPQSAAICQSDMLGKVLLAPRRIPIGVRNVVDDAAAPQLGASGPYVPGSIGSGDPNKVLNSIFTGAKPAHPPPPPPAHTVRLSSMREGDLIYQVKPEYPALARSARVQGSVVLQAVISRQGTIESLRVLAGHPLLVRSSHRCGHPMALSFLRPQQRTSRGRDPNHGELFSLRRLERERSFVTPTSKRESYGSSPCVT